MTTFSVRLALEHVCMCHAHKFIYAFSGQNLKGITLYFYSFSLSPILLLNNHPLAHLLTFLFPFLSSPQQVRETLDCMTSMTFNEGR